MTRQEALFFRNLLRVAAAKIRDGEAEGIVSEIETQAGRLIARVSFSSGVPFYELAPDIRDGFQYHGMLPWAWSP